MKEQLQNNVLAVRQQSPLVHHVVMNNSASDLLVVGLSPIMVCGTTSK